MKTQARTLGTTLMATMVAILLSSSAQAQQRVDETRPAQPDGLVEIENTFGTITVVGWDRDEVSVKGTLGREVDRLDFEVRGRRTIIEVEIEGRRRGVEGSDLEVHVPRKSRVVAEGVNTDITVRDVAGSLELQSVNGDIEADGTSEEVSVSSVNGRVRVSGARSEVNVSSVGGRIRLEDVGGHISVSTVSGDVEVAGNGVDRFDVSSVSGDIEFVGKLNPRARLDLNSHSGRVVLELAADISAEFDVETFSGDIRNELGPKATRSSRFGPGMELRFTAGAGDMRISVETFSGSVDLRKR